MTTTLSLTDDLTYEMADWFRDGRLVKDVSLENAADYDEHSCFVTGGTLVLHKGEDCPFCHSHA